MSEFHDLDRRVAVLATALVDIRADLRLLRTDMRGRKGFADEYRKSDERSASGRDDGENCAVPLWLASRNRLR